MSVKYGKIRTRKTPNTDNFHAMNILRLFIMKTDNVVLCCYVNITVLTLRSTYKHLRYNVDETQEFRM